MSNVLIINPILYTSETNRIPKVQSIKDTMIYTLCLGFLKNGHQVTLAAAEDYRPVRNEEYEFPIIWMKTIWKKLFLPRCFPYMPELRGFLKKHREFELILSSEVFGTWSYTAARVCPEKTILWHELAKHNNILHKIPSKVWYRVVAKILMRKVPVIPRSEAASRFIRQFMPSVSDNCIDHGVNLEKIPMDGKTPKKNQFAVVSQMIERKGIDKTILRFKEFLIRNHREYQLYIIGQGELEGKLKELVKQLQLEEEVVFCGQLSHEKLLPIVAESKALLVSTIKDNNMVSIVESIAAGTPIVTTSVPYNAAYVRRENLGIVADDWDADSLEEICEKNEMYVKNCILYREKLSNAYLAEQFIKYWK